MNDDSSSVLVKVAGLETQDPSFNKKCMIYKIEISGGDQTWVLHRRYNEFQELYEQLKKQCPSLNVKFPKKKLLQSNSDPVFLKQRSEGLNFFMHRLINDETLLEFPEVQNFLELYRKTDSVQNCSNEFGNNSSLNNDRGSKKNNSLNHKRSQNNSHHCHNGTGNDTNNNANVNGVDCTDGVTNGKKKSSGSGGSGSGGSHSNDGESESQGETENEDVCDRTDFQDVNMDLGDSERPLVRPSHFEFLRVIGKGSFGKVFVAKHKAESKIYAVKVLDKKLIIRRNEVKHIMAERSVLLKNMLHPFLIGLHYSFQTPSKLYFVLDYANGGELFFHLQRERYFTESRSQFYAAEICSALGYLHALGVAYRDLKPENILLDASGHILLTDFGLCKEGIVGGETTLTFCGTPEYLAPEIIRKEPYNKSVDWWCLGAVLYEMLHSLPPFYSRNQAEMYDGILYRPLRLRGTLSDEVKNLLLQLLEKDKRKRLGCGESDWHEVRKHPFFAGINWDDLLLRKIKPPFKPSVDSLMDLKNIDPDFTKEPVPMSVGKSAISGCLSVTVSQTNYADDAFLGFSYIAPPQHH